MGQSLVPDTSWEFRITSREVQLELTCLTSPAQRGNILQGEFRMDGYSAARCYDPGSSCGSMLEAHVENTGHGALAREQVRDGGTDSVDAASHQCSSSIQFAHCCLRVLSIVAPLVTEANGRA